MQFELKSIYVSLGPRKSFPNEMRPKSHVATGELYVLIKSSSIAIRIAYWSSKMSP